MSENRSFLNILVACQWSGLKCICTLYCIYMSIVRYVLCANSVFLFNLVNVTITCIRSKRRGMTADIWTPFGRRLGNASTVRTDINIFSVAKTPLWMQFVLNSLQFHCSVTVFLHEVCVYKSSRPPVILCFISQILYWISVKFHMDSALNVVVFIGCWFVLVHCITATAFKAKTGLNLT
jgi:hypothetical protein